MLFVCTEAILIFLFHLITAATLKEDNNIFNEELLNSEDLFEGDLKIPKDMIIQYYNFSSIPGGDKILKEYREEINLPDNNTRGDLNRAAVRNTGINLWPNNMVLYKMDSTIPIYLKILIDEAIEHWENTTCLKFSRATDATHDYVLFTNRHGRGCFSNMIGRAGGRQVINLGRGCESIGIIEHEIGHAIGFWHEHSRPDRDRYVRVNMENVKHGASFNFMSRNEFEVDNQGSYYDYGSLMHYSLTSFSKSFSGFRNQYPTLSITNTSEYIRQGSPIIGDFKTLSLQDILQTNRMYSCPCKVGSGVVGDLRMFIRHGVNLPADRGSEKETPDPYVSITAVDCVGNKVVANTRHKNDSRNPVWDQWLPMGLRKWQYFRISVWDRDVIYGHSDDQLTMSQTIEVSLPGKSHQVHCQNYLCDGYIVFDYTVNGTSVNETKVNPATETNVYSTNKPYKYPFSVIDHIIVTMRTPFKSTTLQVKKPIAHISFYSLLQTVIIIQY